MGGEVLLEAILDVEILRGQGVPGAVAAGTGGPFGALVGKVGGDEFLRGAHGLALADDGLGDEELLLVALEGEENFAWPTEMRSWRGRSGLRECSSRRRINWRWRRGFFADFLGDVFLAEAEFLGKA